MSKSKVIPPPAAPRPATGPVTPQRVRSALRHHGFPETRWHTTDRRQRLGVFSRGFAIDADLRRNRGYLRVVVEAGGIDMGDEDVAEMLDGYAAAISLAGIACEVRDGAVWVGVGGNPGEE